MRTPLRTMESSRSEHGEEELLGPPPPTEYRRMLSWQLSQLQSAPATNQRRGQKDRERRRRRSSNEAGGEEEGVGPSDDIAGEDGGDSGECGEEGREEGGFAYLVVNSDGEEECYYSAPESPSLSEDDEGGEGGEGGREACLPPQERKRGGRSKRAKKRIRSVLRLAEVEFFGPLCDMVEGSLEVDVGGMEVRSRVDVPSLAKLCVRSIHKARLRLKAAPDPDPEKEPPLHLPYLIHALVGAHRAQRSLVGVQVRWLERLLAAWETESAHPHKIPCSDSCGHLSPPLAYCLRQLWGSPSVRITPNPFKGPHLPLPFVSPANMSVDPLLGDINWSSDRNLPTCLNFVRHVSSLLHFTNFLYPLFTLRGTGRPGGSTDDSSLSPSQAAAIARVNSFLTSRYKVLCEDHCEFLKLWSGYVYWARGQVKLTLSAFSTALNSLKYAMDRAVALNEMGKMMLMFGDRYNATLFFYKSQEVDLPSCKVFKPVKESVLPHVLTLQASAWDCGLLTAGAARQATLAWSQVLASSLDISVDSWYLHLAAVESRMLVHSGVPVSSRPTSPLSTNTGGESPVGQWLYELLELCSCLVSSHPLLHYHHSLLLAMAARLDDSRRTFLRFCDNLPLPEWSEGPGDPFSLQTNRRLLNPWLPLCNMINKQGLPHAPIMKLKWRTRLLYPMYPYYKTEDVSYLADHCSSAVNLRFSESGHITADLYMDLPPMRSLLLDPYTGSVCFSRSASLRHHFSGPVGNTGQEEEFIVPDEVAMPWPLRLLELADGSTVELLMSGCVDPEIEHNYNHHGTCWTNQTVTLRWYSGSQHAQLDLRLAIRRELKKAVLECVQQSIKQLQEEEQALLATMKEDDLNTRSKVVSLQDKIKEYSKKTELVTAMMEKGYAFSAEEIFNREKVPSKYVSKGTTGKNWRRKQKAQQGEGWLPRRERDMSVKEFNLTLTEYFVFGEATLALFFTVRPCLNNRRSTDFYRQAVVVINCKSRDTFLRPMIHCAADTCGFINVYPSNTVASLYRTRHLPHISYLSMFKHDKKPQSTTTQILLDQSGGVVWCHELRKDPLVIQPGNASMFIPEQAHHFNFSLGDRVFKWSRDGGVSSYNLKMKDCIMSSATTTTDSDELVTVIPIPGSLLLQTASGLSLLHPGSLERVKLDHQEKQEDEEAMRHFLAAGATLCVVSVFNVEGCRRELCTAGEEGEEGGRVGEGEGEEGGRGGGGEGKEGGRVGEGEGEEGGRGGGGEGKEEGEDVERSSEGRKEELGRLDFGSCCVALTLNSRLLVLQIPHKSEVVRVLTDVEIPGKVTEFYDMGGLGYTMSATLFPDCFREELYWLSPSGKLRGMLPCLGAGRHSFPSLTLPPPPTPTPSQGTQDTREEGEEDVGG